MMVVVVVVVVAAAAAAVIIIILIITIIGPPDLDALRSWQRLNLVARVAEHDLHGDLTIISPTIISTENLNFKEDLDVFLCQHVYHVKIQRNEHMFSSKYSW